jgi:acyl-coenzyme A thioesterase PaaI-like protein
MTTRASRFPGSTLMRKSPPEGYGIQFQVNEDNSVSARFAFDPHKEGPPGFAHGGAVGAVLDEAMGTAAFEADRLGFTATMTINYRASVPLGVPVEVRARVDRIEGSKTFTSAEMLLSDGTIAADSSGVFIVSEKLLEHIRRRFDGQKD